MGLKEVQIEILNRMYEEAEPGLNFDEVLENPEDFPEDWYSEHTLNKQRQNEIIDEVCEEYDVERSSSIVWSTQINYGPRYES